MARSLNRVQLIGNLTRDPELRYTPAGTAVATFSIATNRQWKTESGENKDEAEFHRVVAWDKLAEICGQLLKKGSKTYVEGRIQTRKWQTKEGEDRTTVEIVISEMMLLGGSTGGESFSNSPEIDVPEDFGESQDSPASAKSEAPKAKKSAPKQDAPSDDDIPF